MSPDTENSQLFENVWQNASARIDQLTPDPAERRFLKSLIMGGTVGAETVVNQATGIQPYWGQGNPTQAREISQLFSFLMLSQCYRWLEMEPGAQDTPRTPRQDVVSKLIFAFNTEPEQSADDFQHFDAQYNYDLKHKQHLIHTATLILAKICDILGHQCIDWKQVKFPVAELIHLVTRGVVTDSIPVRDQEDMAVVVNGINGGIQAMMRLNEGK
jgi:hypothetical protein